MKKLVGIIAVLALFTSVASAELLKNFKYDGKVEVNSVSVDNHTDYDGDIEDGYAETKTRLSLGLNFDLSDDVNAQVSIVKNDRRHGEAAQTKAGLDTLLTIQEAYLNLKGVFGVDHKLGRQYYGTPGDLVIYYGPLGWPYDSGLSVNALDAWSGVYTNDKLIVTALSGKVTETNDPVGATAKRDIKVYGLTANYDYSETVKPGVYFYQKDDRHTTAAAGVGVSNRVNAMGLKVNGKYEGLNYGVEYVMNSGKNYSTALDYKGTAMKFNADYDLDVNKVGKFTFMGEFLTTSGDDDATDTDNNNFTNINGDYRPGIIAGGLTILGGPASIANATIWNIGTTFTPNRWDNKLSLCAKLYNMSYTEKMGTAPNTYDTLGSELDFSATWNHSESVSVKAYYAMFTPDSDFALYGAGAGAGNDDATTAMGASFIVKF